MATLADVRRIALSLPGTSGSHPHGFGFAVRDKNKDKGFVWSWKERVHPKKARVENLEVIAVRVANETDKQMLLAADETKFFTEPHYNGFPAVLVRLKEITVAELRELLTEAWRCQAPTALVGELDGRATRGKRKPVERKPKPRKRALPRA
jgi:hypothetical protein